MPCCGCSDGTIKVRNYTNIYGFGDYVPKEDYENKKTRRGRDWNDVLDKFNSHYGSDTFQGTEAMDPLAGKEVI